MTITFQYTGDADQFPENVMSDWNYGDDTSDDEISVDVTEIEKIHVFSKSGFFNVSIRAYNILDAEVFTVEVNIFIESFLFGKRETISNLNIFSTQECLY